VLTEEEQIDRSKLRYVLYARKSTEDEKRQIKSVEDQIIECIQHTQHNHLKVIEVLQEAKSAKKADRRPVFDRMLEDIKDITKEREKLTDPERDRLSREQFLNLLEKA
jgi:DNA invertase Pin-like site-specific DNA recombinase